MRNLFADTDPRKRSAAKVEDYYRAQIAECALGSLSATTPSVKVAFDDAGKAWRELLAIHLECEDEDAANDR